ncbi:MAG: biotin carboxyl carrier protein [Moorellales bacterium]
MGEVRLVDTTVRDGQQSLWEATGMTTDMILSVAPALDRAGYKAIDFMSGIHMGVSVRYHKENPWDKIRAVRRLMPRTPLSFGTTGRRFIGFKRVPDCVVELVLKRVAANGIRRVWMVDAAHEAQLFLKVAAMAKAAGIEEFVAALCFSISPVHTDAYYSRVAERLASSPDIDTFYLKDPGGLLTPERVRSLVPAIKRSIGSKGLEIHSHCNTGLAPICYFEAIRLGVDTVHTAIPPLADGSSLPSVFGVLDNLPHLGRLAGADPRLRRAVPPWLRGEEKYWAAVDRGAVEEVSRQLSELAQEKGLPAGQPVPHDTYYYVHQIPGGMITTLKRQLREIGLENRLDEVVEEVIRVREELGYPIMVTPLSQFVGTQATMNVLYRERYKVIPTEVIQYAAGWFGPPPAPIDPAVLDRIVSQPLAKDILGREQPQPSLEELREETGCGPEVSDEEFLLRYVLTRKEVDRALGRGQTQAAAG